MIYTEIEQPTLAMTEVVIKIMAELMSVLALATEQVSQGRLSMSVLDDSYHSLALGRELWKEITRRI
jgi:hypothetical protein